ncbi:histidine kinase [Cryomorpha ignava]|uniref:Histidine kinase n=1 Tax=Cryomorpha ignava TaxID=101383 RepID=A0A7K3WQ56_9FLAO|nr:histidine kinase [Cryomorpha ignava]NEN23624.1 histidine kinase [Cryomorpha ignava]
MSDEKSIYWMSQIVGWFLFILLILFQNMLTGPVDVGILVFLILNFCVGLTLSHLMRIAIIKFGMLRMKISRVLPRGILLSILTGVIATLIIATAQDLIYQSSTAWLLLSPMVLIELIIPFTMVFLIWNVFYFAAIYLKNYEREEIKNLRLTASVTEAELRNLRAQLNPHFMFNALNSIRALVDEDPAKAKTGITQMSNILRSSLTSGRRKFVALEEEMKVVRDYLDLEKVRFEERLNFSFSIPENLFKVHIPPLLVQTLVENAVKHGISQLPNGGDIRVSVVENPDGMIELNVINTGTYNPKRANDDANTGIGLDNSRRRLNLLYGKESGISIVNENKTVVCKLVFPVRTKITIENENADY